MRETRKPRKSGKLSEETGQSTVEFALTLVLLFTFSIFYFRLALLFGFGNYVHYATFMSARAYLSAGENPQDDQIPKARDVIVRMLKRSAGQAGVDRFPFIAKGFGGGDPGGFQVDPPSQYSDTDPALSWMQGVRYTFKGSFFMAPLGLRSKDGGRLNSLTLTSESWLGRETSYEDCQKEMGKMKGLWDNGC